MLDKEYLLNEIKDIVNTLIKKNTDYGSSFFKNMEKWGMTSFFIRLDDKIGRLESIERRQKIEVSSESVEDTINDIIGYCLLLKHYLNKGFGDENKAQNLQL